MKQRPKQLAVRDPKNLQLLWKQMQTGKMPLSGTLHTINTAFSK